MKELPAHVTAYKRTPTFTEETVPAGLLDRHTTKAEVWARIQILSGSLRYRILTPDLESLTLDATHPGVVEPAVPHQVELTGPVAFYLEFYRAADAG